MEKAILKALIYADIFDYPLKVYEIHRWLIGRKATLRQVEKALEKLRVKGKVRSEKGYYFLARRDGLVAKRKVRIKQSRKYFRKAKMLVWILKVITWIKLVGISGGLAMENAKKSDDIDLFIITSKNRLWLSRFLALGLLSLIGQRRRVSDMGRKIAGKLCLNILVDEDKLTQENKDIYVAHEVLQMKVLWQRDGVYGKYLMDNDWVFKFLPNWVGEHVESSKKYVESRKIKHIHTTNYILHTTFNSIEILARKLQLRIMKPQKGTERILDGALYFHPNDIRPKVLEEYNRRIKVYSSNPDFIGMRSYLRNYNNF